MKLAIVSFGHADSILHFAKTLSQFYKVDLFFVFALNKRRESVLNFENEKLHTGFLNFEQVKRILGNEINNFIDNKFNVNIFVNYNLKIRSLKNILLARNLTSALSGYDLIHFNGMDATLLLINLFIRKKRKVFTIHDFILHSGERGNNVFNFAEKLIRWLIKSRHQVIIQNKSDGNEIIRLFPQKKDKINFIPFKCLSIYREFLNAKLPVIKSDILFFGRISKYKGLKYFVDAIKIVKKTIPTVSILIAGEGDLDKKILERENNNYRIINRYITNEEAASYFNNTKIVVCPYTDATQSGVVMTAFAFGKPVIASALGGFKDVIDDNITGMLIPPANSIRLADAIVDLLSDEKEINEMSGNIKNACDNGFLSWNSIVNDVKNVYDKALD